MKLKHYFSFGLFLSLLLFVSCGQEYVPEGRKVFDKLHLEFDFAGMQDVVVRSTTEGNADENRVESLLIVFFDAAGNKVKFIGQKNPYFLYNAITRDPNEWVGNVATSHKVILPIAPEEAIDKTVVVIANSSPALRDALTEAAGGNEIKTKTEFEKYRAKEIADADKMTYPFLMKGETKVTSTIIPNVHQKSTIPVHLERAIARVDFILHYDWEKLVPMHNTERGYRMLQCFDKETYVGVHQGIEHRVDGVKTVLPATTTSAPTTVFTAYINEYALPDDNPPAVKTPHVLLELPAVLGKKWAADNAPYFPPPAGGVEEFDTTPVVNFYKLVMPRKILRNHYYRVHVHIIGPGAADADSAVPIRVNFIVAPWDEIITYPDFDLGAYT